MCRFYFLQVVITAAEAAHKEIMKFESVLRLSTPHIIQHPTQIRIVQLNNAEIGKYKLKKSSMM